MRSVIVYYPPGQSTIDGKVVENQDLAEVIRKAIENGSGGSLPSNHWEAVVLEVDDPEVDNVGMTTPLLTDSEVAELLRISPRQVLRLARDGALSSIQLSRKETRFDPADVGRFVEFRKRPTE